jgi:hypothetical protein
MSNQNPPTDREARSPQPQYVPPTVRVMDETDVLKAFQITSAGQSWWVM